VQDLWVPTFVFRGMETADLRWKFISIIAARPDPEGNIIELQAWK